MRSILGDLERAHDIAVAMQSVDPAVIARGEADTFRAALLNAVADLDICLRIAVRNNRKDYARSDSTAGGEAPVNEPHQASVESDEPHSSPTPTND